MGSVEQKNALVMVCSSKASLRGHELRLLASETMHLWLVDDASTDGTLSEIRELSIAAPGQIHLVHLPKRLGFAEALRQGLLAALAYVKSSAVAYEAIGAWDAAMGVPLHHVQEFATLLANTPGLLGVRGYRARRGRRSLLSRPHHYVTERAISTLASRLIQLPVGDIQAQAQMYLCNDALSEALASPFPASALFDVTLLSRLSLAYRKRGLRNVGSRFLKQPLPQWSQTHVPRYVPLEMLRGTASLLHTAHKRFHWSD